MRLVKATGYSKGNQLVVNLEAVILYEIISAEEGGGTILFFRDGADRAPLRIKEDYEHLRVNSTPDGMVRL